MPFINGIGPGELIIILIIALLVVGPGKLPDVGSALGKSIREFRKAATDVKEATSLDPVPAAPTQPGPAQAPAADAAQPTPIAAPVPPIVPAAAATPVAPAVVESAPAVAETAPALAVAETAPAPAAAETAPASAPVDATPDVVPVVAEAAPEAAAEWPAELAPVDEQQPTPSA
jgi:TatA/E family protein of Tat protein translocase